MNQREKEQKPLQIESLDREIILRQYTITDAEEAFALINRNREHLSQFGDDTAEKYPTLESFQESIVHPKNRRRARFGIRNEEGVLVGSINLTPKRPARRGEIGYYLGAEFQGRGYATKAVETITDYAFQNMGYEVLYGDVERRNYASERVLLMAGYIDHEQIKARTRFYAYKDYLKGKTPRSTGIDFPGYLHRANQDPELSALMLCTSLALGEQGSNQLLRIHQRFERPSNFDPKSWEDSRLRELKDTFRSLPDYLEAAQAANLTEQQYQDLLFTLLSSSPYDFERDEINILLLSQDLNQMAEKGTQISPQNLRRIKTMIRLGGKDGLIDTYLYSLGLAHRIGLSIDDSTAIISHFSVYPVFVHPGYATKPFISALDTLKVADVRPQSVKEVFGQIEKLPRSERGAAYNLLEEAFSFLCPSRRITPQELIDAYSSNKLPDETIIDFFNRVLKSDNRNLLGKQEVDVVAPSELRERYFILKPGRLEHAVLPYRTNRSLKEGVEDLKELAVAKGHLWEDVGEGFWVFDPNSNTWYSFGGKTELQSGRVRHNMLPFDISELSDRPYLFHVHPEDLEVMLRDPFDDFPSREYKDHVTKFFSSTPSRADYALVADLIKNAKYGMQLPRSFIAHSLGISEFVYPENIEDLEKMAVKSRDIRDQLFLNYRWDEVLRRRYKTDEVTVVRELIDDLNRRLPIGFAIKLQPTGSPVN